jgi:hypothetical protein
VTVAGAAGAGAGAAAAPKGATPTPSRAERGTAGERAAASRGPGVRWPARRRDGCALTP